jgi:hypothetical protein
MGQPLDGVFDSGENIFNATLPHPAPSFWPLAVSDTVIVSGIWIRSDAKLRMELRMRCLLVRDASRARQLPRGVFLRNAAALLKI